MFIHDFWVNLFPQFIDFQLIYLFLDLATIISFLFIVIVGPFWLVFGSTGKRL